MKATEFLLSVDEFQNPIVLKDSKAIMTLLVRLLLLEPGTIQSHPDMGVGLISKYRYGVEGIGSDLQAEFKRQIQTYLPDEFQGIQINVKEKDKTLQISAEIDGLIYGIAFDSDTLKIQTKYSNLSDL